MNDEMRDLARVGAARGAGLLARGLDRTVDLPKKNGARGVCEGVGIGERKRKDVGRLVGFAKIAVQAADKLVTGQDNGGGRAGTAEPEERAPDERPKSGQS